MELNQKFLEMEIESLESWYVKSVIELIKWPVFIEQINKELKEAKTPEKKKSLEDAIKNNETNAKWHRESIENLEKIMKEVYKLRK